MLRSGSKMLRWPFQAPPVPTGREAMFEHMQLKQKPGGGAKGQEEITHKHLIMEMGAAAHAVVGPCPLDGRWRDARGDGGRSLSPAPGSFKCGLARDPRFRLDSLNLRPTPGSRLGAEETGRTGQGAGLGQAPAGVWRPGPSTRSGGGPSPVPPGAGTSG